MTFETGQLPQRLLVYLAGAISKCPDGGAAWRLDITPHLDTLGYDVFNPVIEQPKLTGVSRELLREQKASDLDAYQGSCKKIVDVDLAALKKCALVVCKLDEYLSGGAGTFGELTVAKYLGIPVFGWVDYAGGLASIPDWAMGCLSSFSLVKNDFYKLIPNAEAFTNYQSKHLVDGFSSGEDELIDY